MKNLAYLIILCTFFSCTTPDKLSVYIKAELKKNNGTIDLTKFNDVKWDKLYVISPYASDDSFDRFLNDYKDEIKGTGVTINEMKTVLALFEGDKMVSMSELYNDVANFQQGRKLNGEQIGYYTPQNAVFKYKFINGYNTVVGDPN
ncbi:MAG: hypothetical protein ACQUHE_01550 [Bacteroidia bacterium]